VAPAVVMGPRSLLEASGEEWKENVRLVAQMRESVMWRDAGFPLLGRTLTGCLHFACLLQHFTLAVLSSYSGSMDCWACDTQRSSSVPMAQHIA
jgi:hypothetical protein